MGKGKIVGVLLCIVGAIVFALYVGFVIAKVGWLEVGLFEYAKTTSWFVVLPVAIGVWVVSALAVWLGWIMATTKEVTSPPPEPEKKEEAPKASS